MVCIYCGGRTSVSNSRASSARHVTWRRRTCDSCSAVFTTREHIDLAQSLVVSYVGSTQLEPFQREILFVSVLSAIDHITKDNTSKAARLTDTIIDLLLSTKPLEPVISHKNIATTAFITLTRFDTISGIKYQAYRPNTIYQTD